ncbi:MAG TPA: SDR family oxidoreductase [bacterium]|nr:SDR family oxidoreductase [bacterium]
MGRKTAFVTGAAGFFGANLARELLARGWEVTAFHRASSDLWRLKGLDLKLRQGSFAEPASVESAIPEGVDAVFHVAARVSFWRGDDRLMLQDNVEATRTLVGAARKRGARRFIYTSSVGVYGHSDRRVDESFPRAGLESPIGYFRTKAQAEQVVLEAVQGGLDAVILNPANIIGPLDTDHWGRSLIRVKEGKMPGMPPGAGSFVHAVEAAKAHVAAFEKGKRGGNYILAGTDASYAEVFRTIEEILGAGAKVKTVPEIALRVYAGLSQWGSLLTGKPPEITPELVAQLCARTFFDSGKAQRELGLRTRTLREMFLDCWESLSGQKT